MSAIGAIGSVGSGSGMSAVEFQAQFQAKTVKLQKEAIDMQGQMAMQLIQSATVNTGQSIDIQV